MATFKKTYQELRALENVAGSRQSFDLYKLLFTSSDLDEFGACAGLEAGWTNYAKEQDDLLDLENNRKRYQGDAIGSFTNNLESGFIPPPETLLAICDALNRYLMCNGALSLDEAFFGAPHVKNTSYGMAKGTNAEKMGAFSFLADIEKLSAKPRSQVQIAEDLLANANGNEIDPESFLRAWRRWRKASVKWDK